MTVLLSLTVLCVLYIFYRFLVYPVFISPLSRIPPAHPTARISPAWILWTRYVGRENVTVYEAHKRLGPLLRLGPNEISVNCVEGGIKTVSSSETASYQTSGLKESCYRCADSRMLTNRQIYSGNFDKGSWYSGVFNNYGIDCMFSMENRGAHTSRKRMLSNIYAKSVLHSSPTMAEICKEVVCRRMLPCISRAPNGVLDAYELFCAVTMDGVTGYQFGLKQSSNHTGSKDMGAKWLRDYKARQDYIFFPQELPLLTKLFEIVGLRSVLVPKWVDQANQDIEAWTLSMGDAAEKAICEGRELPPGDIPVVYSQLRSAIKKNETAGVEKGHCQPLTDHQRLDIASEMLDHLAAGFDTSGITLTYLAWRLSRPENARIQLALQQELRSLQPPFRAADGKDEDFELPDPKHIDELPMLQAIVLETLRLHAAIPGGQPRVTPANTSLGPPGAEVHGIPAGVRVVSYGHSLHRNPDVFPEPETWRPERWLDAEGKVDATGDKSRFFWAFGSGGRMCIGSNLAIMEIKHVVAALWSNFSTVVVDDAGMQQSAGRYTDEPLGSADGNYLLLRFDKVKVI